MFSFCCLRTRNFSELLVRLGDGSLLLNGITFLSLACQTPAARLPTYTKNRISQMATIFCPSVPKHFTNSDLPLPMVWPFRDHGLRPWSRSPSEHCKPYACRIFYVLSALFWIWSRRPCAQGVGVDPCLLKHRNRRKFAASSSRKQSANRKYSSRFRRRLSRKLQKKTLKNRSGFGAFFFFFGASLRFSNCNVFGIWKRQVTFYQTKTSCPLEERKKQINNFNINFLALTQKTHSGPPEKIMCLMSW